MRLLRRALLLALSLLFLAALAQTSAEHEQLHRSDFPKKFLFGAASSAYQYEGAADEDGRGPSIWDTFTKNKSNTVDGSSGSVSNDEYHRYKEDIERMSKMGIDAHRFSFSWSRLIPEGRGRVNQLGVDFYNNLINGLLEKGIKPFATLHHFDLPQDLQDAYGGWLSPQIVDDFAMYAEMCFREFGDRVKHWITFNEPSVFVLLGFNNGSFPPGRCSKYVGGCASGDSGTEPYIAGHNVLLSHAAAVRAYRDRYQVTQGGSIGMTFSTAWYVPMSSSDADVMAVQRALDFSIGWFLTPSVFGDYPASMRVLVGDRLPSFTFAESSLLKGSLDFIGINYYSTYYASTYSPRNEENKDFFSDMRCFASGFRHGVSIGPTAASSWLYINPYGIYSIVQYVRKAYNGIPIFITENGVDEATNFSLPLKQALDDRKRIQYHRDHLLFLNKAIRNGADVRGYFVWSLLDDFEWTSGYSVRFGLFYVDFTTLKRYPKTSVKWFTELLHT
ncbi:hypothetical protein GOP47_0002943 [Adiantum capillus-veneris]|uniref:Beta-glucosidase n=1 Tax=Adiantum capillus-veneris TaxID=13818 RepID=A0A9D4ZS26_ADICA|nr:hypothetical protein GOP47_0002943 [Adiantum capillus-veneris]